MKPGLIRRLLVALSIAWFVIWFGGLLLVSWFLDETLAEAAGLSNWLWFIIEMSIYVTPLVILWSFYAAGYWVGHVSWPFTGEAIGTVLGSLAAIGLFAGCFFLYDLLHPLFEQHIWGPTEASWNFQNWHPWLQNIGDGFEFLTEFMLALIVAFFVVGFIMLLPVRVYEEAFSRKSNHEND